MIQSTINKPTGDTDEGIRMISEEEWKMIFSEQNII
jgi:hypothetical protein